MFNIGDKIVYPMHGAGVIEAIEEKEILGNKQNYYIVRIPIGDMKVMIPIDSIDDIGIREVIDEEKANKVLDVLRQSAACETINWNKRYRENMLKIKSGDIFEVAEVVKNLMIRDKEKGLSTGEKKMLNNARQILISELVLVKNTTPQEIESIIKNNIGL
ncbi:MAG: CarD family transcriptional regulator [Clostridiaceae bacterium]|jgi:CarD family transcriptional regulator|nr:CarD family transcriptional regulator [Clostridiaceae bacterium]